MKTLHQFLEQGQPTEEPKKEDPKLKQDQKKENMLKKRVLMTKNEGSKTRCYWYYGIT